MMASLTPLIISLTTIKSVHHSFSVKHQLLCMLFPISVIKSQSGFLPLELLMIRPIYSKIKARLSKLSLLQNNKCRCLYDTDTYFSNHRYSTCYYFVSEFSELSNASLASFSFFSFSFSSFASLDSIAASLSI